MSAKARMLQAQERLEELSREEADYYIPSLPAPSFSLKDQLSLLNKSQIGFVTEYLIFDLGDFVDSNPVGEEFSPGEWFVLLNEAQKQQVVDYLIDKFLSGKGLVLTQYRHFGQNDGYRFEVDIKSPVASR